MQAIESLHPRSTLDHPADSAGLFLLQAAGEYSRAHNLEKLAPQVGKQPKVLAQELNANNSTHKLGLETAVRLSLITHDFSLLKLWAQAAGLMVIERPDAQVQLNDDLALINCFTRFTREVGDVATAFEESLADARVTTRERLRIRKEAQEAVEALFHLIFRVENLEDQSCTSRK